jgi:MFS transporter, DHA2 family, multidrug resistance protein
MGYDATQAGVALPYVSYVGIPGDQANEASAMLNLFRNLGGSVGVSFAQTLLQERTQFRHASLTEHITAYRGFGWKVPLAPLNGTLQAPIMSCLDIFRLLGIVALCIWPLALFLPRMPKGATSGHGGGLEWR